MRIINVSTTVSYIDVAKRTLAPGESSAELPLTSLIEGVLNKLIDANRILIRLSDADRVVLARIIASDSKPIPEIKPAHIIDVAAFSQAQRKEAADYKKARIKRRLSKQAGVGPKPRQVRKLPKNTDVVAEVPRMLAKDTKPKSLAEAMSHNLAVSLRRKNE